MLARGVGVLCVSDLYANDAHPAGVSITKVEVENYAQGARWSPEHDCWVGTRPDFTGETMRLFRNAQILAALSACESCAQAACLECSVENG